MGLATITRFEEIEAWQTVRDLVKTVYRLSAQGAFARDFGLWDQVRRAAVSVLSNIAEGFESRTRAQFVDDLGRAKESAGEVGAQAYVALDLGYLEPEEFEAFYDLADKPSRQVYRLMAHLRSDAAAHRVREHDVDYIV